MADDSSVEDKKSADMGLSQQIKGERLQRKVKRPFTPSLFTRVAGLVRDYRLDLSFLEELDAAAKDEPQSTDGLRTRDKSRYDPPLFALVTEAEYRIASEIMDRVRTPYLFYANSPDEILLCNRLFALDAAIEPDILSSCHFAALLWKKYRPTGSEAFAQELRNDQGIGGGAESSDLQNSLERDSRNAGEIVRRNSTE